MNQVYLILKAQFEEKYSTIHNKYKTYSVRKSDNFSNFLTMFNSILGV